MLNALSSFTCYPWTRDCLYRSVLYVFYIKAYWNLVPSWFEGQSRQQPKQKQQQPQHTDTSIDFRICLRESSMVEKWSFKEEFAKRFLTKCVIVVVARGVCYFISQFFSRCRREENTVVVSFCWYRTHQINDDARNATIHMFDRKHWGFFEKKYREYVKYPRMGDKAIIFIEQIHRGQQFTEFEFWLRNFSIHHISHHTEWLNGKWNVSWGHGKIHFRAILGSHWDASCSNIHWAVRWKQTLNETKKKITQNQRRNGDPLYNIEYDSPIDIFVQKLGRTNYRKAFRSKEITYRTNYISTLCIRFANDFSIHFDRKLTQNFPIFR